MYYNKNPLTPHLQIYRWNITSLLSITHRIVGVINFFAISFLCLFIILISYNENNYEIFKIFFNSFIGKFFQIALYWTFSFHILNEIRHLFWDMGYGFDLKISKITGVLTLIGSFALTIIIYIWEKKYNFMKTSTKKWLFLKFSSVTLIPLMFWFMLYFLPLLNQDYQQISTFLAEKISRTIISVFLVVVFFFYSLTITEIFEDYIKSEKIKMSQTSCAIFLL